MRSQGNCQNLHQECNASSLLRSPVPGAIPIERSIASVMSAEAVNVTLSHSLTARWDRLLLGQPIATIAVVATLTVLAAWQLHALEFDASADTLVVEGDENLAHYHDMLATFGETSFVVLTYTPRSGELFDTRHLGALQALQASVATVGVSASPT